METGEQSIKKEELGNMQRHKRVLLQLRWVFLAVLIGGAIGAVSSLFSMVLTYVTKFREANGWIFFLMPFAGVCIVFLYRKYAQHDGGTNQVLAMIRSQDDVAFRSAPLIFITTVLTHLVGGSAGREGAALQLGGSIGNKIGKWLHMDPEDRHVIAMCGMSAAFAAMFGTPLAAAFFSMEVISVGIMYYAALMPCAIAAMVASGLAGALGIHAEAFHVLEIPAFTAVSGLKIGAVALGCAVISILFCLTMRETGKLYQRFWKNGYIRIIAASAIVIVLTLLLQTDVYMGAGTGLIIRAVEEGKAGYLDFFWKILLTALTMKAGFRGGEIVPSFCIGATFGCVLGQLLGISPSFCAAIGMTAVFCGVTNCPVTSILIAFEMFGFQGQVFYLIAIAVSYAFSGHYSLYKEQRIVYSKYKAKYVNQRTE